MSDLSLTELEAVGMSSDRLSGLDDVLQRYVKRARFRVQLLVLNNIDSYLSAIH